MRPCIAFFWISLVNRVEAGPGKLTRWYLEIIKVPEFAFFGVEPLINTDIKKAAVGLSKGDLKSFLGYLTSEIYRDSQTNYHCHEFISRVKPTRLTTV